MNKRRITGIDTDVRQSFSEFCRHDMYQLGLAFFQILVNMWNSIPNFKEEINVA
jgi:hypothetical protein